MKPHYSQQIADELKQKQAITECLINKILYSKRLLIDHVEALEHCMLSMHNVPQSPRSAGASEVDSGARVSDIADSLFKISGIFTARNTCLMLGSTLLEHFITPKALRLTLLPSLLITSGFSAMYVVKNVFVFRNKIVERELDSLIRTIDEFGNCIRRNMTYFNEILIMKQQELIESRQIERAWDCITAAKEVTEILYDATRKLEALYPIPHKFSQYYSPMEELRDCEYFKMNVTDYSPKHIKDFHNIFAYVQSQFLLRLALTVSTKPSISQLNMDLVKIDGLIRQLVQEEETHFKNLAIELNKKKQLEIEALNATKTMQNRTGPVAVLQDSSLRLSACMVAVAGECQALDITLQRLTEAEAVRKDNAKQLIEVANNMRTIENAISLCCDDFQRLMLVYNKFLSSKLDEKSEDTSEKLLDITADNQPESYLRVEISQNLQDAEKKDDFFAFMFDEKQSGNESSEDTAPGYEREILNFDKRLTKSRFRPVLKQLKNRIDPIRQEMLEKERKILAAKGINVDELFDRKDDGETASLVFGENHQRHATEASESDSDDSAEKEYRVRTKKLKERDNFAEMRNFLAQKQAVNLFQLDVPPKALALGDEDILE